MKRILLPASDAQNHTKCWVATADSYMPLSVS